MKAVLYCGAVFCIVAFVPFTWQAGQPQHVCPCNSTATECNPCNPVCNEAPRRCAEFCIVNATFCRCDSGFELINANSTRCVLKKDCPNNKTKPCNH